MARFVSKIIYSGNTTFICIIMLIAIYGTRFVVIDPNLKLSLPSPDGGYADWGPWSSCYCGRMTRNRTCTNPVPKPNGRHCADFASSVDVKMCNVTSNCRQDGGWSIWEPWSDCKPKCKETIRYSIKLCDNPPPMYGGSPCKGPVPTRSKTCEQYPSCPPVDGGFGKWEAWSVCSKTCDEGLRNRQRKCNNPEPKFNGKPCEGKLLESDKCKTKDCTSPTTAKVEATKKLVIA